MYIYIALIAAALANVVLARCLIVTERKRAAARLEAIDAQHNVLAMQQAVDMQRFTLVALMRERDHAYGVINELLNTPDSPFDDVPAGTVNRITRH